MIIGISGKIGSGKDTVGKIMQYLTLPGEFSKTSKDVVADITYGKGYCADKSKWQIKKFAGKLKEIVSILTGISVEDLEKQEVKNRVLGEEWNLYYVKYPNGTKSSYFTDIKECDKLIKSNVYRNKGIITTKKLTVRELFQEVANAMRDVIHPNIRVNALFSDYVDKIPTSNLEETKHWLQNNTVSNWTITDVRFPNELEAIKDRSGISIRVERPIEIKPGDIIKASYLDYYETVSTVEESYDSEPGNRRLIINGYIWNYNDIVEINGNKISTHVSETALDNAEFDYVIENKGSLEELVEKVKQILIKEKLI